MRTPRARGFGACGGGRWRGGGAGGSGRPCVMTCACFASCAPALRWGQTPRLTTISSLSTQRRAPPGVAPAAAGAAAVGPRVADAAARQGEGAGAAGPAPLLSGQGPQGDLAVAAVGACTGGAAGRGAGAGGVGAAATWPAYAGRVAVAGGGAGRFARALALRGGNVSPCFFLFLIYGSLNTCAADSLLFHHSFKQNATQLTDTVVRPRGGRGRDGDLPSRTDDWRGPH